MEEKTSGRRFRERGVPVFSAGWRYSLEDTRDRQRRGFASLEVLVSFLLARMEEGDEGENMG